MSVLAESVLRSLLALCVSIGTSRKETSIRFPGTWGSRRNRDYLASALADAPAISTLTAGLPRGNPLRLGSFHECCEPVRKNDSGTSAARDEAGSGRGLERVCVTGGPDG